MKHPKDIAANLPQTAFASCVPWATEMILRTFEKDLPSPRPQDFQGLFGYDEAKKILKDADIESSDRAFGKDFGGFERAALTAIRSGVFPIVCYPSYLFYHWESKSIATMNHAFMVFEEAGALRFVTWFQGEASPRYISRDDFEEMRFQWTSATELLSRPTDEMLHTLFPEPVTA